MNGDRWNTILSIGDDAGLPRCPLASVTLPSPPANVLAPVPLVERLHRAINPEPRIDVFDLGYTDAGKLATDFTKPAVSEPEPTTEAPETNAPLVKTPQRDMRKHARSLLAAASEALTNLDVAADADLKSRSSSFLAEFFELTTRFGDFLTEAREKKIARLTAEQEAAAAACREQEKAVARAASAVEGYAKEIHKRQAAVSEAQAALLSWGKTSVGRWPTAVEKNHWEARHQSLKAAMTEAEEALGLALEEERHLIRTKTVETEKLSKLDQAEWILRKRLAGESWFDPEVGLEHLPEL